MPALRRCSFREGRLCHPPAKPPLSLDKGVGGGLNSYGPGASAVQSSRCDALATVKMAHPNPTVLVIEDHPATRRLVCEALEADGFATGACADGVEGLARARDGDFEALVLDIMLPGIDGLGVLKALRGGGSRVPVLLLSARGEVDDRVNGLNAGADDYLAKPFAMTELVARLRAMLRRGSAQDGGRLGLGDLEVDSLNRRVRRGDRMIELSNREFQLLVLLLRSAGRVCTRMMILEQIWNYDFDPGTNIVDVYVRKLRGKVDAPGEPKLIHSVRGSGYMMKEEISEII